MSKNKKERNKINIKTTYGYTLLEGIEQLILTARNFHLRRSGTVINLISTTKEAQIIVDIIMLTKAGINVDTLVLFESQCG